ncbi:MAG: hypothetical protein AAFX99_02325 [Myxococcota bacterium]
MIEPITIAICAGAAALTGTAGFLLGQRMGTHHAPTPHTSEHTTQASRLDKLEHTTRTLRQENAQLRQVFGLSTPQIALPNHNDGRSAWIDPLNEALAEALADPGMDMAAFFDDQGLLLAGGADDAYDARIALLGALLGSALSNEAGFASIEELILVSDQGVHLGLSLVPSAHGDAFYLAQWRDGLAPSRSALARVRFACTGQLHGAARSTMVAPATPDGATPQQLREGFSDLPLVSGRIWAGSGTPAPTLSLQTSLMYCLMRLSLRLNHTCCPWGQPEIVIARLKSGIVTGLHRIANRHKRDLWVWLELASDRAYPYSTTHTRLQSVLWDMAPPPSPEAHPATAQQPTSQPLHSQEARP